MNALQTKDPSASQTPEYRMWKSVLAKCQNPNCYWYPIYGGKGIKVCKRWASFQNFLKDMGPRPSEQHIIARKDRDGDYSPQNCYWSTRKEQALNRSNNRILTFRGVSKTITEWAKETGLTRNTIEKRIDKCGWSVEDALNTPVLKCRKGRKWYSQRGGLPSLNDQQEPNTEDLITQAEPE